DLKSQWQTVPGQPGRHGNRWQPCQVHRYGEDIVQIHGNWIVALFAQREGGTGRRRSEQHIAALERLLEIPLDERADFLSARIIRVVVPGRQHVSADQHAAPYLGPKAFGATLLV